MFEEVAPSIYKVKIPLPHNPLGSLNSYFIKGNDRTLIVDTGFNIPECKEAMYAALHELDIDLQKTDFFITHLHADHSGLVANLTDGSPTAKVYCTEIDSRITNDAIYYGDYWHKIGDFFGIYGFPAMFPAIAIAFSIGVNPTYAPVLVAADIAAAVSIAICIPVITFW